MTNVSRAVLYGVRGGHGWNSGRCGDGVVSHEQLPSW